MISVVSLIILLQAADELPSHQVDLTALGVAIIGTLGLVGVAMIQTSRRAAKSSEKAADNVGQTNGQGTLAVMMARIDDRVEAIGLDLADVKTRATTIDSRLARHESAVDERLTGLHRAVVDLRERVDTIEDNRQDTFQDTSEDTP